MPAKRTKTKKGSLYSLHPSFAMEETARVNLKERTGKTLEQWVKLVKKSAGSSINERWAWLKEQGLTTNYARWVAEQAEGKGSAESYDPEAYVATMFSGPKAALKPIYDKLLKLGLSVGKDVKACPCQTIVPLFRKHVFAQIKPATNTRIDIGFALKDMKPTGRLIDTGGFAKKDRITHRIPITSVAEIGKDVDQWLKKAYAMDA
jgi:hypothetical protein